MKPIKFRVWDTYEKIYTTGWKADMVGTILRIKPGQSDFSLLYDPTYEKVDSKRYIAEYSTGVFDKNGQEIYAGDIIIDKEYTMFSKKIPTLVSYQEWESCGCCFYQGGSKAIFAEGINLNEDSGELEIIGNINQNPELLEEK